MSSRSWNDYKPTQRLQCSLNPIRNWAEQIRPAVEEQYAKLHEVEGLTRPEQPLFFLIGDPTRYHGFQTPEQYRQIAAEKVGLVNGYTDFFGDVKVREALAKKLSTDKWKLTSGDIILTMGGSKALYYCLYALCNKGDKFLCSRPSFPLMHAFAQFLGVDILWYDLEESEWQPRFDQIEEHLATHQNIKFILVNTPSNPLGSIMTEQSTKRLIKICEKYNNLPIVADEIYEKMVYPGKQFHFISDFTTSVPVFSCSGLTKRCLVPGWRMGWIVMYGKPGVFDEVKRGIRGLTNIMLMPNTVCQMAVPEVYEASEQVIPTIMENMSKRFHLFFENLKDCPGVNVGITSGSMYTTLVIHPNQFRDIESSRDFAIKLQLEENVSVFPGELFNGNNFLRIVICADFPVIDEACIRIKRFCQRHIKNQTLQNE